MPRALNQDALAALQVLQEAGFSLAEPVKPFRCLAPAQAAERLGCSTKWIQRNLSEFRGAFRVGSLIRIPESDLESLARRRRIFGEAKAQ